MLTALSTDCSRCPKCASVLNTVHNDEILSIDTALNTHLINRMPRDARRELLVAKLAAIQSFVCYRCSHWFHSKAQTLDRERLLTAFLDGWLTARGY